VDYKNISSLKGRIREIIWEIDLYKKTGDANGHSLTQRFEYWKTASMIIKNNLLIGVGTGDVAAAFDKEYIQSNSSLYAKWRLRAHNQYLSIAVGMGLIGLLWFLITLFYPMYKLKMQFNYLYMAFFIIALVSFFTEDTLETQAGVTFFAFFNSFFLFLQPYRKEEL
jgi:O-antigen ligase